MIGTLRAIHIDMTSTQAAVIARKHQNASDVAEWRGQATEALRLWALSYRWRQQQWRLGCREAAEVA